MISLYGGATAPDGWLLCDGSSYSVRSYPDLYKAIGFAHGGSANNFNVPDMRGRFPRGVDGTSGRDPDVSSRTASNTGGNTGNAVGSVQTDAFQGHRHNYSQITASTGVGAGASFNNVTTTTSDPVTDGTHGTPRTASETRPLNVYLNFIIKT